ncbi:hypothetical protein ONE63_006259 [Megalurothrips usitatus]|uniref:Cyclin-dependent kinase inhibitor domain-containing protein n=1 Tax=Megalurothrips usitatus TaxID=439358 RepID=A0AAV7XZR9_9NEOP|nr:hypothetical protein ONE63_006259 [Megalurothrips usitatus]
MMSSRCSALGAALQAPAGPKRCLFGAPPPADTQRLLREDQDAVKSRMARRWGWDLDKEGPAASSTWQWEAVRPARRHPYAVATPRTVTPAAAVTPVPAMLSPLAATPTSLNTSSTSSSSGTSTLPGSPASPAASPPTLRPPTSWASDSEDSCCGDSDSDSSTTCGTSPRPVPVQTRITGEDPIHYRNQPSQCFPRVSGARKSQLDSPAVFIIERERLVMPAWSWREDPLPLSRRPQSARASQAQPDPTFTVTCSLKKPLKLLKGLWAEGKGLPGAGGENAGRARGVVGAGAGLGVGTEPGVEGGAGPARRVATPLPSTARLPGRAAPRPCVYPGTNMDFALFRPSQDFWREVRADGRRDSGSAPAATLLSAWRPGTGPFVKPLTFREQHADFAAKLS